MTRPRKESSNSKQKDFNVKYNVQMRGIRTRVCKSGFKQTYGYTSKQCHRLFHLLRNHVTPKDNRGQNAYANPIPESVNSRIRDHIESYPTIQSNYANNDTRYLAANLNIMCSWKGKSFPFEHPEKLKKSVV